MKEILIVVMAAIVAVLASHMKQAMYVSFVAIETAEYQRRESIEADRRRDTNARLGISEADSR